MGPEEEAKPIYLGVDVAGAGNTWVSALSRDEEELAVVHGPCLASLQAIVSYCEKYDVVAAAIDAQLTMALPEENGFRTSDMELRDMLGERHGSRGWVMSFNSLTAVPVRGRLLVDHLSPTVGTLLETHPRASLLFGLGEGCLTPIREYKKDSRRGSAAVRMLRQKWLERFGITCHEPVWHEGALDSLVCATVAHLFHHAPITLCKLRHDAPGKAGRGPFYVLAPNVSNPPGT
jgi:predicted nuclease with RNAse H fold